MIDQIVSAVIVIAALAAAVVIDLHGGDPEPYRAVAVAALGYGVGHTVQKVRSRK